MTLVLLLALLRAAPPAEPMKKVWEAGASYSARDRLFMQARYQVVRDAPAYRLTGLEEYDRTAMGDDLLLGDLLFHAPRLLGPRAATLGVSCATCHPAGAANNTIFIEVAGDRPGNIDLLSDYFYAEADDGIWAPRNIPSLRGCASSGPYRRNGSGASLAETNAFVVQHEFQQSVPAAWLAALNGFVVKLELHPGPFLDGEGRLNAKASALARAGEACFDAPRAGLEGKSCASCHPRSTRFTDQQQHALWHGAATETLGKTTRFDTPVLLNSAETPPYFFDGSAWTYQAAVEQLDRRHGLRLSAEDRSALAAYLEAIGAVERKKQGWTPAERVRQTLAWARLAEEADEALWPVVLDTMRFYLQLAVRDGVPPATTEWRRMAAAAEKLAASAPTPETRAQVRALLRAAR